MRKLAIGFTLSTIIMSAVGVFLRSKELDTVFDPVTGLARTAPITYILAGFSVLTAAVIFLYIFRLREYDLPNGYENAFKAQSPAVIILSFLLAALMIYASFKYYFYARTLVSSIADSILALFAALSGIAFLTLSINAYKRKSGPEMPLCCFIIVIFICYWLILTYKLKAADPVILDYVYDALALCSAALAVYYITGYCYQRGSHRKTLFFTNLSAYLSLVALIGAELYPVKLFYAFTAAFMLIHSVILILNLKKTKVVDTPASSEIEDVSFTLDEIIDSSKDIEKTDE